MKPLRIYAVEREGRTLFAFGRRCGRPLAVHRTIYGAVRASGDFCVRDYRGCLPWRPKLAQKVLLSLARRNDRTRPDIAVCYRGAACRKDVYTSLERFFDVLAFYFQGDDREYACLRMGGELRRYRRIKRKYLPPQEPQESTGIPMTDEIREKILAACRGPLAV